jgi:hypothetical protein
MSTVLRACGFSFSRVCGQNILRFCRFAVLPANQQTGLQFCGLLVISLEVVVQCCPDDLIVFHLFFGGMQAYFFDQARLKSRCIFFWPLRGIAGGLACGFAVLPFCGLFLTGILLVYSLCLGAVRRRGRDCW